MEIEGFDTRRDLSTARDASRPATSAQTAFRDSAFSEEMAAVRKRIEHPAAA